MVEKKKKILIVSKLFHFIGFCIFYYISNKGDVFIVCIILIDCNPVILRTTLLDISVIEREDQ